LKKPVIEPLDPDKTKYKKLRTILNSKSVGSYRQRSLQRSIVGECCICAAIPTKRVIHALQLHLLQDAWMGVQK
jgi:hypothetical protein